MSNYITEKDFEKELKRLKQRNVSKEREQRLKEEKQKYKTHITLPSTSKLMAAYLFIVLNVVLFYAMKAMWHFADLTFLGVLITDVAGQILVYMIYALKSKAENTTGGIVYETAMAKMHMLKEENEAQKMSSYDKNNNAICSDNNAVG